MEQLFRNGNGVEIAVLNYGATLFYVKTKDKYGNLEVFNNF